jgi:hypothetical protein
METGEAHTWLWWGIPEGKRRLGRPRRRWEDNMKMDIQEVSMDWIDMARDRDRWGGCCKCGNEPSGSIKMRGIS